MGKGKALNKAERTEVNKIVNRKINVRSETKHHNNTDTGTNITDVAQVFDMCLIPQSNADTGRDGDVLELYKFEMNYSLIAGDATNFLRLMSSSFQIYIIPERHHPDQYQRYFAG